MVTEGPSAAASFGAPRPPEPSAPAPTTGDLADALQRVCDEALNATVSDSAFIFVEEGVDVVCIAAAGRGRSLVGWRLLKKRSPARISFDTKAPVVIDDALRDRRADPEVVTKLGVRSIACAPVLVRSLAAAALEVHSTREKAYGPATQEALVALSHRATSAFRKAIRQSGHRPAKPRLSELPGAVAYQERLATIGTECETASLLVVVVGPPLEVDNLHKVRDVLMGQRASDYPFVVDADAFAVIMPDTPREGAEIAARRIRGILRDRGLQEVGLGTADIGADAFTSHEEALSEAMTDLRRPPPPVLP